MKDVEKEKAKGEWNHAFRTCIKMLYTRISCLLFNQVMSEEERDRLTSNIAGHLSKAQEFIQKRAVRNFSQADPDYGRRIQEKLDKIKAATSGQVGSVAFVT